MNKPIWNVYIYNINLQKIEIYNIFNHEGFKKDVALALRVAGNKEGFAQALQKELRYYFWSKCEWEIEIVDWLGHQKSGLKTDVYKQVMLNFDVFVDYVWRFKNGL